MVAIWERTHLDVISILGIIIVSCDRLLERDWCAPYGARATRAIRPFVQTPSRFFRRGDWLARLGQNLVYIHCNNYELTCIAIYLTSSLIPRLSPSSFLALKERGGGEPGDEATRPV